MGGILLKMGFIGAGKVGKAFGSYIKENDGVLTGYFSRSQKSAQDAANLTDSRYYSDIVQLVKASACIFITTPDSVISEVAHQISAEAEGNEAVAKILKGKIFVHMSGAHSSAQLKSLKEYGSEICSLHPIQSIADVRTAVEQLKTTVFSLEGTPLAVKAMSSQLESMHNTYFVIEEEQKTLYHMAACTVSNYLVTLVDYGLAMYEAIGIDRGIAYKALYPLIRGTVENLKHMDTKEALTGPISRGDIATVKAHLEAVDDQDIEKFYRFLGYATVQMAKEKPGTDIKKLGKLEELLDDEVKS
jgi:predicted short-subunit dehydrogenase-like oxidoreductase (DUF2520 family)